MNKCFVIQPFDKDKYDKRYKETFSPAIKNAGLEPYRVDNDPSVSIPIDEIQKNIKESRIVFAEITENNPNVWFELGFAIASNKEVILVCSDERKLKFPFDIQHRSIIKYDTSSASSFMYLSEKIEERAKALFEKTKVINDLEKNILKDIEGLGEKEQYCLGYLMANQLVEEESVSAYGLKNAMNSEGYTDFAVGITIKKLKKAGYISTGIESDYHNNDYPFIKLTNLGEEWIYQHEEIFTMKLETQIEEFTFKDYEEDNDDVPF